MRANRKRRLIIVCLIITGVAVAVGLTLLALKENINVFYSPSQIVAGEAPSNSSIRVGGMVVDGSVNRNQSDLNVTFSLTDTAEVVTVTYSGILPDLFREGQGIVALGKMDGATFVASQVLAKHDETYMPPEVNDALKAASKNQYNSATKEKP